MFSLHKKRKLKLENLFDREDNLLKDEVINLFCKNAIHKKSVVESINIINTLLPYKIENIQIRPQHLVEEDYFIELEDLEYQVAILFKRHSLLFDKKKEIEAAQVLTSKMSVFQFVSYIDKCLNWNKNEIK